MKMVPFEQLNEEQRTALEQFRKHGHLILRGPRRSGRTSVLQWIIATCPAHYNILVVSVFTDMIKHQYGDMDRKPELMGAIKFLKLFEEEGRPGLLKYDLIVVEEGIIHRDGEFKTACTYNDEKEPVAVFGKPSTTVTTIVFEGDTEGKESANQ